MIFRIKEADINEVYNGTDDAIEKAFDEGGYELIAKQYDGRLPKGYSKLMTKRSHKIWLRYLRWRWRHAHPEFVSKQNKYWWRFYKNFKPCICTCKYCGKQFGAARRYYTVCPACHQKPSMNKIQQERIAERRKMRNKKILEAKQWYDGGLTQQAIAKHFGVAQKTISNWLKK